LPWIKRIGWNYRKDGFAIY